MWRLKPLIAPPPRALLGSGITRSGSILSAVPRPLHDLHMPSGELKLNDCGSNSGKLIWQASQYRCSEKSWSVSLPTTETTSLPLPHLRAVSTESVTLGRLLGRLTSRSTTISTWFRRFLSSVKSSSSDVTLPSMRMRANPERRMSSMSSRCSPFLFSMTGASKRYFVPSSKVITWSTICSADCGFTTAPH